MTADATQNNTTSESLWMVTRQGVGDVVLRWEDLTDAEREDAIRHHNKLYPQQQEAS